MWSRKFAVAGCMSRCGKLCGASPGRRWGEWATAEPTLTVAVRVVESDDAMTGGLGSGCPGILEGISTASSTK